ncbi:hypothetical protein HWB05_gp041 [Streptomyces phage BRock]|uniref:Uncharacterized protein n=1 Tax=Streptomyces phage BRock TaxID=1913591 RepID=A0A1J0GVU0_9CAUD|nr:hypothetical protein HWB05_gp041 [Streptomyces phage BRock]APC46303.1 hypothetical protein [Streptomyces phage BRock]
MAAELTAEQQAALDELKASAGGSEGPMEVTTAFLVVQHKNGQWSAHADYDDMALITERKAHMDDFVGGAANISLSCQVQQSAMHTLVAMNQQATAMQQQMESQRIAQSLKLK